MKKLIILICIGLLFYSCNLGEINIIGHKKKHDGNTKQDSIMYVIKALGGSRVVYTDSDGEEISETIIGSLNTIVPWFKNVLFNKNIKYQLQLTIETNVNSSVRMSIINPVRKTDNELNLKWSPLAILDPSIFQGVQINLSEDFNLLSQ